MATMLPQKVIVSHLSRGQGIAGPPGPAGPASGAGLQCIAAHIVSGHTAVALDADGDVSYASADRLADKLRVLGVTLGAAVQGAEVTVISAGPVEHNGWNWTVDQPVFLGLNGAITQALPVGALFQLVIGQAVSPTRLLVSLQPPVVIA